MEESLEEDYVRAFNCRWVIFCLPVLSVFFSTLACILSYIISVKLGKIEPLPFMPFLSDVSDSSMFTLGLCISAMFTLGVLIIRYHQVKGMFDRQIKVNHISLYVGCIFVFGKLITACYHISTNKAIHYTGGAIYFIGAFSYGVTQLYITRSYIPGTNQMVSFIRTICCVMMVTGIIVFATFLMSHLGNSYNIAQIAEWTILFSKSMFMISFTYDFWKLGITIGVAKISDDKKSAFYKRHARIRYGDKNISMIDNYDTVYFDKRSSSRISGSV